MRRWASRVRNARILRSPSIDASSPSCPVRIRRPVVMVGGELVVRGVNVMRGYHGHPEATAEAMTGGWFHTGDLGYVDEDGYFFIVDRKKDLIIRGGYNVYPREIEEVLYEHPAIQEAAVIGVPDDSMGEEVAAAIVLKQGEDAVKIRLQEGSNEETYYVMVDAVEFRAAIGRLLSDVQRIKAEGDYAAALQHYFLVKDRVLVMNDPRGVRDANAPRAPVGADARLMRAAFTGKPRVFVLVLGETARAEEEARRAAREMAGELLLVSQRALPTRLLDSGFTFAHPDVTGALNTLATEHLPRLVPFHPQPRFEHAPARGVRGGQST